ncbi:MAG TPA: LuxR C-terminal-related transcriptional regulator [Solirubrobacteraceae bacterium]|nr:LuxR C-terminal-related transcriptional regulator [Solirubrobacteraceae bacterium]
MVLATPLPSDKDIKISMLLGQFDAALLGFGLRYLLRQYQRVQIVGYDVGDAELESSIVKYQPQIVVLDEGTVELSILTRVRAMQPATTIIVFGRFGCDLRQTTASAIDPFYLSQDAKPAKILATIRLAAEHRPHMGCKAQHACLQSSEPLTRREREVRDALRGNETYDVLAARFHITPETFRVHARRVRRKLGVQSRWDLTDL